MQIPLYLNLKKTLPLDFDLEPKTPIMDIFDLRRDFSLKSLDQTEVSTDPINQFEIWFKEALRSEALEPNAMTLSTATPEGKPSSRVVLLKQIQNNGFVFFTNYDSKKGKQIEQNPYAALNFIWHELERQVKVEGKIRKISDKESDYYFDVRPPRSKLGAWASPQSEEIPNREYLENIVSDFERRFEGTTVKRPINWGGYILEPTLIEFWQGRSSRLHDRIQYLLVDGKWKIARLAP